MIAARAFELALEHFVAVWIESPEAQILEFELDRVETEPFRDRRIDVEGLAGDATTLDRRHDAEGAHVVHAVGELDHDDADIAHHREQHLAKALGLSFLAILELNLVEFTDAVDEIRDDLAEDRDDFRFRRRRVFDDVVQDRGNERVAVEAQVREDVGDRDRVGDVWFAGNALLALMPFRAEFVGFAYPFDLSGR